MAETNLLLIQEKEGIAWLTLNRPEFHNAINRDMLLQLSSVLDSIRTSSTIKAVIFTGAGDKSFSAGADIKYLHQASPLEARELALLAVSVNNKIETLGKLIVAAINGYALGGGLELAEACTLRVAASHAMMGHPEVKIGAVAGWGGITRLPRLIGKGRAAEILLTGRLVNAEEALQIGLLNKVVESENLYNATENLVNEILSMAPLSTKLTWEALHRGLAMTPEESALLGADYFGLIASSQDFREGTKAFMAKTKPSYLGR
jgi:enoyl-CoA hydratase